MSTLTVRKEEQQTEIVTENTLLKAENINIYYGKNHAVKDLSLAVNRNEILALIGPSGCGKSTFLRSINRMNDLIPSASVTGKMMYEDVNLLSDAVNVVSLRKEIGMVFQKANPFPKSIYDNLTHGLRFHGVPKKEWKGIVEESLTKAALWDEVKDRLHESALDLSGGQQQRLCIARTLALKPEVILLDEPASALDPIATAKVEELMIELKKQYTVVVVTHNMQQASRVSDRTAFFYNGELIETNSTEKLFSNPDHKQTEAYISGRFG
ncbi:phosphate ABC transporter ATP-binding protein PstB [Alkalihalobacillus sp. LMS6]|uniref:phosphate ABC transporter ATP-binding protein PstB n=1 Tax=Alkalihalobacillus sp. LMS6 TaxID=2924034 RepID=UPI0020D03280|nr:phosphate ABC transporter ATP-binding protein PstB [Alkalihalobacillus sp. LMS6]UTR05068.1 phosphate ABC transporter ATP-binding protein PstB [Alkalihalobacillus sp. LMS6]